MNADRPPRKPSGLGRCILAGLIAGVMAALLANLAALVLARQFNQPIDQLNWFFVCRVAMVACVGAAFGYAGLARWTKRAALWFVIAGLGIAGLASAWVATHPFVLVRAVNPLPFIIAITAVLVIPILAPALPRPKNA